MIATCQFCRELIVGPNSVGEPNEAKEAYEYRQLSMLVSAHMADRHDGEAGNEIMIAMAMAGAAIAMRYVTAADPAVDNWRTKTGLALMESFHPAPPSPLVSLRANQAASADPSTTSSSGS